MLSDTDCHRAARSEPPHTYPIRCLGNGSISGPSLPARLVPEASQPAVGESSRLESRWLIEEHRDGNGPLAGFH